MKFANFIISSAVVSLGIVESEIVLPAQFVDQEGWFFDGVAAIDGSRPSENQVGIQMGFEFMSNHGYIPIHLQYVSAKRNE